MYRKTFPAVVHTLSISIPLSAELMFIDTHTTGSTQNLCTLPVHRK